MGSFDAYTSYTIGEAFTVSDNVATSIAGIEAENVTADLLKKRFTRERIIDGRIASLYAFSQLAFFSYANITHLTDVLLKDAAPSNDGNDIKSYIRWMNLLYPEHRLSTGGVRGRAWLNFLDPYLWYSWLAQGIYVVEGVPIKVPMIPVGKYGYLPSWRSELTPYGIEHSLINSFACDGSEWSFYLRGGKHGTGYGGAGVDFPDLFVYGNLEGGVKADAWYQPRFNHTNSLIKVDRGEVSARQHGFTKHRLGGLISASLRYAYDPETDEKLFLEIGGKSRGYKQGYPLQGALIVRGGLQFRY